ncbi:MAG: substrate-binding domain-containing protein, partial [Dehalococcoidia bacterium]|nr:substrate-binding domain-containing protein [Dehalococcoidia bacterium]
GQPVITVGQRVDHPETDSVRMLSVDIDAPLATKRMLDHLADRGADRVDLFATEPIDSFERDSIEAYRAWCADRSLEPRITLSESLGNEDVDRSTALILNQVERPDAIYATIDELALVLLDHCHSRGVEVPADLLIGTAGDGERTRNASPPLTVLDDRPAELGAVAARTLIEAIENPGDGPVELLVETDVLIRASTTPQRGSSA